MCDALLLMVVQAAPAAVSGGVSGSRTVVTPAPWWYVVLSNSLALTILFIFLAAIVSVLLSQRRRDKCLKFLHGYRVTYLTAAGLTLWGKLTVYSQGVELTFHNAHTTRTGLTKSAALIYDKEMAGMLAICRADSDLDASQHRRRQRQIHKTFKPGLFQRTFRWGRNLVGTLKDAFSKALTAIIGTLIKTRAAVIAGEEAQVQEIGQTMLGAAANAYEPILEAHIGGPVILDVVGTSEPTNHTTQIPGYLADYTATYIAVFNVDHTAEERIEMTLTEAHDQPNLKVELTAEDIAVTCTGPDVIVVRQLRFGGSTPGDVAAGGETIDMAVPLLAGCQFSRRRPNDQPVTLVAERTRRIDIVVPRAIAGIHFAADSQSTDSNVRFKPGAL